jgi:hypothetical protein
MVSGDQPPMLRRRPRPPRGDRARSGRTCRHRPAASGTDTGTPASPRTGRPDPATAAPRTSRRGRRPYLCRVEAGHPQPGQHARRSGGLGVAFRRRLRGRRVGRVPCLELECLAAVVAGCHGSVTLARPAPEASGQIRAIRQTGSSAAPARQHDADALVLGSDLARRRPRLEALCAQAPVEIRKRLQHSYSSHGGQHSAVHRNACAGAQDREQRRTPKLRENAAAERARRRRPASRLRDKPS